MAIEAIMMVARQVSRNVARLVVCNGPQLAAASSQTGVSAQCAATSSWIQSYHLIQVVDPEERRRLGDKQYNVYTCT